MEAISSRAVVTDFECLGGVQSLALQECHVPSFPRLLECRFPSVILNGSVLIALVFAPCPRRREGAKVFQLRNR